MLTCPWCKKKLASIDRECPNCRADLSLLVEYVGNLAVSVDQAEQMVREGRLAEAVWMYLELLDVDPENAEARRQVGRVAAAVRWFDSAPPGRRRFPYSGLGTGVWVLIVVAALLLGFVGGMHAERWLAEYHAGQVSQEDEQ